MRFGLRGHEPHHLRGRGHSHRIHEPASEVVERLRASATDRDTFPAIEEALDELSEDVTFWSMQANALAISNVNGESRQSTGSGSIGDRAQHRPATAWSPRHLSCIGIDGHGDHSPPVGEPRASGGWLRSDLDDRSFAVR